MTSAHQQLLLQALKHKNSGAAKTETQQGYRALVVWLEHTQVNYALSGSLLIVSGSSMTLDEWPMQIRHYATEHRKDLSASASDNWPGAFAKVRRPHFHWNISRLRKLCGVCPH